MDLAKLKKLTQKKPPASKPKEVRETTLVIRNSFCTLEGFPEEVMEAVAKVLTYKNDIEAEKQQLFRLMKMAKAKENQKQYYFLVGKLKELEATEYVCWLDDDGNFPTGHLNIVKDVLKIVSKDYTVDDTRKVPENNIILRWKNKPFDPRYYQREMIDLGIEEGRGVFESAVGSGKSLVMTYLLMEFSVVSLVVIPSRGLLEQHKTELELYFGRHNVQHVETKDVKKKNPTFAPIRLMTPQTLASLKKQGLLHIVVKDVDALYCDEFHHAGSKSYTDLLEELDHVYYRFGFTGTFLRNDNKTLDMWGVLSNKLYSYPAWKAIEEGYLTPLKVMVHTVKGVGNRNYQTEYKKNYCREKKEGGEELLFRIKHIVEEFADSDDQILILVNRKDAAGKIIHKYLDAEGIDNTYISGDDSKELIHKSIEDFNDKKIRVLIGSSVIGEGIDIRSTDHLIMAQGGKSEIAIVQASGRAVRLFDGKDVAYIHDFRFTGTKYMEKHLGQRIDIYMNNFDPEIIEVDAA